MAYVISISNQKGGVGKTTTAVNLGADLAVLGNRVLVVDMDAQGSATDGLGINKSNLHESTYDVLVYQKPIKKIIKHAYHNLDVAPATDQLYGAGVQLTNVNAREQHLKVAIQAVQNDYDYILIDCPPSLGLITINAFCASNSVLIPVQSEYYALEGLSYLFNTVKVICEYYNPTFRIEGILITMFYSQTKLSKQVTENIRREFRSKCNVYQTVIPHNIRLAEAPSHKEPIYKYDKNCKGSKAYMQLTKEVLKAHGE